MENNYMSTWKKASIRIGTPTNLLAVLTSLIPAIYLCSTYDCWPDTSLLLTAWGMVFMSYGAFYVIEPVSMYASLGMSGTYISYLAGNAGNMRLPCAALALENTKSETGTMQAEIVSTMAICGSVITNLIATTAAAVIGMAVVSILPEFVKVGLQSFSTPAIFGALFGNYLLKDNKIAIAGMLIPLAVKLFLPIPAWLFIALSIVGPVVVARLFYVKEKAAAKN